MTRVEKDLLWVLGAAFLVTFIVLGICFQMRSPSPPRTDGPYTDPFEVRDRQVIDQFGEVIVLRHRLTGRHYLASDRGGVTEIGMEKKSDE